MTERRATHLDVESSNPFLVDPADGLPSRIAVIGAGTIGPDIAYFFKHTRPTVDIVVVDIVEEALKSAEAHIEGLVEKGLRYDQLDGTDREDILDIQYTTDYADIAGAELVIEAVTEDLDVKRQVVAEIEEAVDSECIITSNTSSIPAERIFSEARHPERTTITHFFAPAWRNPAVELVNWQAVERSNLAYLYRLFGALGKLPLVVEDELAFMLDRVFVNWCNEAGKLLDRATAAEIDSAVAEFVRAGPFAVLNLANGNPIHVKACTYLAEENDVYQPEYLFRSVETWDTIGPGAEVDVPADRQRLIRDRLLGALFSQATDIVDRGIGTRADLNLGCEAALGFEDGPFDVMTELGSDEVTRILDEYAAVRPEMPTPDRDLAAYLDFDRHLVFDRIDETAVITIRRPHRGNILSTDLFDELERALRGYADDPAVEGVVLTGFGPGAFSSGFEIDSFLDVLGDYERSREYARMCSDLFEYMHQLELPVVAAINGHVMGAGLELAIRCHSIVAMDDTYLQFPEVTLGILPGIGGMVVPYRRWPEVSAETFSDMIRFAERLSTVEAAELGIVDRLSNGQASLLRVAVDQARSYGGLIEPMADTLDRTVDIDPPVPTADPVSADGQPLSPEVDEIICDGIAAVASASTLEDAFEAGYEAFARTATTDAASEGISAFLEKREPDLRGESDAG